MPLYEYQCTKCKRRTEKIESMNGPHLKKCPHCGAKVEQMLTAPAIQFKGTGWYVTDYGKGGKSPSTNGSNGKSESKSESSKSEASKSDSSKSESGKSDSSKSESSKSESKSESKPPS